MSKRKPGSLDEGTCWSAIKRYTGNLPPDLPQKPELPQLPEELYMEEGEILRVLWKL